VTDQATPSVEDDPNAPVRFMQQVISLDYVMRTSPTNRDFGRKLREGRIVGHKCPSCGLVYTPPRGFCPICVVETSEADEVEISDKGIVTSWTVLTPIQYHGQTERDDYALASILLEGADGTIGQQRLVDVELDEIRMGMRVAAVWSDESERGGGDARGFGFGNAIKGFRPTGEPDAAPEQYEKHTL
jgi:uncharacterized OB-fold protein